MPSRSDLKRGSKGASAKPNKSTGRKKPTKSTRTPGKRTPGKREVRIDKRKDRRKHNKEILDAGMNTWKFMEFAPAKAFGRVAKSAAPSAYKAFTTDSADPLKEWWAKEGKKLSTSELMGLMKEALKQGPPR